jgi:hypothetical protein
LSIEGDALFDWALCLQWIKVTTAGWILGMVFIHPADIAVGVLQ